MTVVAVLLVLIFFLLLLGRRGFLTCGVLALLGLLIALMVLVGAYEHGWRPPPEWSRLIPPGLGR